jgi:hypothetical protein
MVHVGRAPPAGWCRRVPAAVIGQNSPTPPWPYPCALNMAKCHESVGQMPLVLPLDFAALATWGAGAAVVRRHGGGGIWRPHGMREGDC